MAHQDARVGLGASAPVDHRAQRHVQVQFTAFFLVAQAHTVLGLEHIEQALQLSGQYGVFGKQAVDQAGIAAGMQRFVDTDPVGSVILRGGVPFGVVARRQTLNVGQRRRSRLGKAVFLVAGLDKGPEVAVVVPVADHGVGEEHAGGLVALAARAGGMAQRQPCDLRRAGMAVCHEGVKFIGKSVEDFVVVAVRRVQQGARQHRQPVAQAACRGRVARALDRPGMKGQQKRPQPGILPKHEVVDARVFEALDGHALQWAQVVSHLGLAPATMAGHMGQGGAVAVESADVPRSLERVINIGQRDAVHVEERHGHAVVVEAGAVAQQGRVVLPQAAQCEVELAFHRDQQGAMPFPLQHGAAVCGLQGEVVALALRVVLVMTRTVVGPARQASDVEHVKRTRRVLQEDGQPRALESRVVAVEGHRGALHQFTHHPQVVAHRPGPEQAARHCRQALQQRRDRPAVGRLLHRLHQRVHIVEQVFADDPDHRRPFLKEGQHRLRAPAHAAQGVGAVQVRVDAGRAQRRLGLEQTIRQHGLHGREPAGEARAPGFQLHRLKRPGEDFRRRCDGGHRTA